MACESNQETKEIDETSLFTVELNGKSKPDSIILYDKTNAWEVISTLKFLKGNIATDTLKIDQSKILQIYTFTQGKQASFGEFIASDKKPIKMQIDAKNLFESRHFTGEYQDANNYLSFISFQQNKLSKSILIGLDSLTLESSIKLADKNIKNKGEGLISPDTIAQYGLNQFIKFTDILRKKNKKYVYKKELIGSTGVDFTLQDVTGKSVKLTYFKGKYLYIDVWATWCKPCKEEYPFLTKLANDYSVEDLVILSVSIDKDADTWKKYLHEHELLDDMHFYTGATSEFVQFYDIGAIPRFILIDPEGKVLNADEIRPSNLALKAYLNELIKKDL